MSASPAGPPAWTEDPWLNEDYLAVPPEGADRIGTLILKHIKYTSLAPYELYKWFIYKDWFTIGSGVAQMENVGSFTFYAYADVLDQVAFEFWSENDQNTEQEVDGLLTFEWQTAEPELGKEYIDGKRQGDKSDNGSYLSMCGTTLALHLPAGVSESGLVLCPYETCWFKGMKKVVQTTVEPTTEPTTEPSTEPTTEPQQQEQQGTEETPQVNTDGWIQLCTGMVKLQKTVEGEESDETSMYGALLTDGNQKLALSLPGSIPSGTWSCDYSELVSQIVWGWNYEFEGSWETDTTSLEVSEHSKSGCYLVRKIIGGRSGDAIPPWRNAETWIQEDYLVIPEGADSIGTLILKHRRYHPDSINWWGKGTSPNVVVPYPVRIGTVDQDGELWTDEFGNLSIHWNTVSETVKLKLSELNLRNEWLGEFINMAFNFIGADTTAVQHVIPGPPNDNGCRITDVYMRDSSTITFDGSPAWQYERSRLEVPEGITTIGTVRVPSIKLVSLKVNPDYNPATQEKV